MCREFHEAGEGSWKGVCERGCHERGRHEGTPPLLVNKQAVRNLLECFLVERIFPLVSLFYTSRLISLAVRKKFSFRGAMLSIKSIEGSCGLLTRAIVTGFIQSLIQETW